MIIIHLSATLFKCTVVCVFSFYEYVLRLLIGLKINFSVGIFTNSTTPHKLVSWAVRSAEYGGIHHLYTLEEYRGRGLASAVVREMSTRVQDKGQVPFCEILVGNTASVALFNRLGFNELYYRRAEHNY